MSWAFSDQCPSSASVFQGPVVQPEGFTPLAQRFAEQHLHPHDLPLVFHPAATLAQLVLIRSPTLERPQAEFSCFAQGDGLVTPPDFVSMIGTLLPIAPCGRSSL